jgi:hypothetical protein
MTNDNRLQRARDEHELYFRAHPKLTDRDYLLAVFDELAAPPGTHEVFGERLSFGDALDWQGGRFDTVTLEDRNLPAIAEKGVLRCRTESARKELDAAAPRGRRATRLRRSKTGRVPQRWSAGQGLAAFGLGARGRVGPSQDRRCDRQCGGRPPWIG